MFPLLANSNILGKSESSEDDDHDSVEIELSKMSSNSKWSANISEDPDDSSDPDDYLEDKEDESDFKGNLI